jgi:hypothetical protein
VPAADADALAAAMAGTAADLAGALAAAERRRKHIKGEFSLQNMWSRIESVYRDGISRRRRGH